MPGIFNNKQYKLVVSSLNRTYFRNVTQQLQNKDGGMKPGKREVHKSEPTLKTEKEFVYNNIFI